MPSNPASTLASSPSLPTSSLSLLDIVCQCHNYPHPLFSSPTTDEYHAFHLYLEPPTPQIGFITKHVFQQIVADGSSDIFVVDDHQQQQPPGQLARVGLSPSLTTFESRSEALNRVARQWRDQGLFKSALDGWRDEQYAVYASEEPGRFQSWSLESRRNRAGNAPAFQLERAACALFGLVTYGVHLTAFTHSSSSSAASVDSGNGLNSGAADAALKLWTPRRAANKATWPGYLDNSVAGGITSGDRPRESVVRECWEEAGLSAEVVEARLKQVGVITYVYRTPEEGFLQPEVEYVYDLPLPNDVIPRPIDGEAEDFQLLDIEEVKTKMAQGQFKPNCALVILDLLIRHGVVNAENEPRYMEVVSLLHNDLGMPGP